MQAQLPTLFPSSVQAQATYSLSTHIAAMGNYGYFHAHSRSSLSEVGIGYFTNLTAKQHASIFAGYDVPEPDL
ncbi:MAG: hypothetical protein ORN54_14590 [Cyclobacteriaceae bacterium]|nr:hypothetical protein [Cyclobacteriaceae bacterium]